MSFCQRRFSIEYFIKERSACNSRLVNFPIEMELSLGQVGFVMLTFGWPVLIRHAYLLLFDDYMRQQYLPVA